MMRMPFPPRLVAKGMSDSVSQGVRAQASWLHPGVGDGRTCRGQRSLVLTLMFVPLPPFLSES